MESSTVMLSAREYFAAAALPALIAVGHEDPTWMAVQLADQLVRDLAENPDGEAGDVPAEDEEVLGAAGRAGTGRTVKPGEMTEALYAPVDAGAVLTPAELEGVVAEALGLMLPACFTLQEVDKTRAALLGKVRTRAEAEAAIARVAQVALERSQAAGLTPGEACEGGVVDPWKQVKEAAERSGLVREAVDTFLADLGLATWQDVTEEHVGTALQAAHDRGYILRTNEAAIRDAITRTMEGVKLSKALEMKDGWTKRVKEVFDANDLAIERLVRHLEGCYMKAQTPAKAPRPFERQPEPRST